MLQMKDMNRILKKSIQNFKYVMSAQVIVLLLGFIKAIVIPLFLSVENFGYWQIYLFYASYVGMFSLGFNDGIYLRYGSYQYDQLPHKKLRTAIRIHIITLMFFTIGMILYSFKLSDVNQLFVFFLISGNILVMGLNGIFVYVLQITNKMKEYSFFSILPKVILMFGAIFLTIFRLDNFKYIILLDFISKIISVIGMIIVCKELWLGGNSSIPEALTEYKSNIFVGIQLMIAQLMGMFVTGIGRFIVEILGDIKDFAYYSFGVTLTNLVLVLITSVSLILYPTLKRLDKNNYPKYYNKINLILQRFNLIVPLAYFVSVFFIIYFIPKYAPVLKYLNLLFGVIILQAKMQLLNNTFYKALRKETAMMKANLSSVLFFSILSYILFSITKAIWTIALCTFVIMLWRCYFSEIYLRNIMNINDIKEILKEVTMILIFISITSILSSFNAFLIYVVFIILAFYRSRKEITLHIKNILRGGVSLNDD